jgi:hypothetical protein
MCGTVRSVDYNEDANRSILHIQADSLSLETRNIILAKVLGMEGSEDEALPFRVVEEPGDSGLGGDLSGDPGGDPLSDADMVSDGELQSVSSDNSV